VSVLPDYLEHDVRVVFCGTAAGKTSASRGHYYSRIRQRVLAAALRVPLDAASSGADWGPDDHEHGIGLTDLAKKIAASSDRGLGDKYDIAGFIEKMERYTPAVIAFHGKEAAKVVSRTLGHGRERPARAIAVAAWRVTSVRRSECEWRKPERSKTRGEVIAGGVVHRAARIRWAAGSL